MFILKHRRRREKRTDYVQRLALAKSGKTRLVVRKTLSGVIIQFVNYETNGDKTVAGAVSKELKKFGWTRSAKNVPAAYLTGLLAGKKAAGKKVTEAVLDAGLQTSTKGSRIYAAVKGVIDAGINVPHSPEILPTQDRISGKHIGEIAVKMFEQTKHKISG